MNRHSFAGCGECALSVGAKFPDIWSNVLDISGEKFPGADRAAQALATVFGGNRAAYAAQDLITMLAHGHSSDMDDIFTVGSNDNEYRPQAQAVTAAAIGWTTTYSRSRRWPFARCAGRRAARGFSILYRTLGLSTLSETL